MRSDERGLQEILIDEFLPQNPFWRTLMLAAFPAAGSLVGALLAEFISISRRTLSLALHAVAGLLLAVVGIELMPQLLQSQHALLYAGLFMTGALFTLGLDWAIDLTGRLVRGGTRDKPRSRREKSAYPCRRPGKHLATSAGKSAAWTIFAGVAIDFVTDGMMIVSGSTVGGNLGLMLGIALFAADSPEAFATIANMKKSGGERRQRVLLALSFPVILMAGALVGEWWLHGASQLVQVGVLAFTAGIILTLVESEIIPETFENWDGMLAALVLTASFIGFALLSSYVSHSASGTSSSSPNAVSASAFERDTSTAIVTR